MEREQKETRMLSLFGYEILEEIALNSTIVLYRAHSKNDNSSVLIKTPRSSRPDLRDLSLLQREREICEQLQGDRFLGVHRLEKGHPPALILEDFGGIPLDKMFFSRPVDVSTFLEVALAITKGLMEIHRQNILHLEVTPSNIFIHPETREIRFTGFGKSVFFRGANPQVLCYLMRETWPIFHRNKRAG